MKSHILFLSLLSGILLFVSCYLIDNSSYSFIGGANIGQRIEQIKLLYNSEEENLPHDILLINTAYDRQLIELKDSLGLRIGNIDITERSKILSLLEDLKESKYKYIILDIAFINGLDTEQDDTIFSIISQLDNIIVGTSGTLEINPKLCKDKTRFSEYDTHILENNFVKYEFIKKGQATLPYQMFIDLYKHEISKIGAFYFFNGNLANKSVVLRFPIKVWNKFSHGDKRFLTPLYYNLGSDLLDVNLNIKDLSEGKIIVIGDYTEKDLHDTYLGPIAGPVINLNAYYALVNDNLSIPWWIIIFLIFLYSTITFCILKKISLWHTIPFIKKISSKIILYFISLLGISSLLIFISVLMYLLFDIDINILFPSLYFSLLLAFIKLYQSVH